MQIKKKVYGNFSHFKRKKYQHMTCHYDNIGLKGSESCTKKCFNYLGSFKFPLFNLHPNEF